MANSFWYVNKDLQIIVGFEILNKYVRSTTS